MSSLALVIRKVLALLAPISGRARPRLYRKALELLIPKFCTSMSVCGRWCACETYILYSAVGVKGQAGDADALIVSGFRPCGDSCIPGGVGNPKPSETMPIASQFEKGPGCVPSRDP